MTKLPDVTNELTSIEDDAFFYVYSQANPSTPDRKVRWKNVLRRLGQIATPAPAYASLLQLTGAKLTRAYRAGGTVTISALAAGDLEDKTVAVTGAVVGDHVVVTPGAAPESGVGFVLAWVSAADTVTVRVGNLGSGSLTGGDLVVSVLVLRSAAPDA
jgi:hypothetical protein